MAEQINFKRFKWFLNPRGTGDVELENSPDGWVDTNITYTRSAKYRGLSRQFTLPLKFVHMGALILRREFWMHFLNGNVLLTIQKLNQALGYSQIYQGKVDFSKAQDNITNFTAPIIPNDFTKNIDAYDSVQFAIPLDVPEAINVEITPITLNESANLFPGVPPDGIIHSDYFPPIQVVNNQQRSINASVQNVAYGQLRGPDFSTSANWFYCCRYSGKLSLSGGLGLKIDSGVGVHHLKLYIKDNTGTIKYAFADYTSGGGLESFSIIVKVDTVIDVTVGQKLFLYMEQVDAETGGTGISITGGELDLSYKTSSPASMCKALRGHDLFAYILQAMNINNDSGPNLPVPNQSYLLDSLKQVVYTSADSIRAATGSIYTKDTGLYPGTYVVLTGTANYNGGVYTVGQTFSYTNGIDNFTGDGVVQKKQSTLIGAVVDIGENMQVGATYLVHDNGTGGTITYNGIAYSVDQEFKCILGQLTYTALNDSMFVTQITESPQIIISFADFFQSILSVQGGDASFGIEKQSGKYICFLEKLNYVYRKGINNLSLGITDKTTRFEPATDMQYNSILAGYKDQQYDAINGVQEVNSTQTYTSTLFAPDRQLDLQSALRADPYGIETVRITQNDSAASRSDNDTFMIWLNSNPELAIGGTGIFAGFQYWHPMRTEGYTSLTGVDPSYYNYMLSPKQCLLRGGAYLSSIFYNMKGYQLKMASALKNSSMVYVGLDGRRVAESDPINISDLPAPLFCPIYAFIQAGLPSDVLSYLDNTPYADLNFDTQGMNIKAFINSFSYQVGNEKPQEIKLLLAPNNNFLKMINR